MQTFVSFETFVSFLNSKLYEAVNFRFKNFG